MSAFLLALLTFMSTAHAAETVHKKDCTFKKRKLYGKVQVVQYNEHIKVKIVEHSPDLKIKPVEHGADSCGEWKFVEYNPDIKVKFVDYSPDLKIKFVEYSPGMP